MVCISCAFGRIQARAHSVSFGYWGTGDERVDAREASYERDEVTGPLREKGATGGMTKSKVVEETVKTGQKGASGSV